MFREVKLNNINVKPIVSATFEPKKVRFGNVFSNPYNCTLLVAKRASGKTSCLNTILQKQGSKKTTYFIFCPTTHTDATWQSILESLKERGSDVNVFDSIYDGKTNIVETIINELTAGDEKEEKKGDEPKPAPNSKINFGDEEMTEDGKIKVYKEKKLAPKIIFVFDDCAELIKNPQISRLCKLGRHLKASIYISVQYPNDIPPMIWKNCDYMLCFRSFSEDKLEHVHKHTDLSMPFETFKAVYEYVHSEGKYNFLFCDVRNQLFRKNFNREVKMLE